MHDAYSHLPDHLKRAIEQFADHPKLDPDFKTRWLADLATARQGKAMLVREDDHTHCCLGRACIVLGGHFEMVHGVLIGDDDEEIYDKVPRPVWPNGALMSGDNETLDDETQRILGIDDETVLLLTGINDNSDNFAAVRKFIEENL